MSQESDQPRSGADQPIDPEDLAMARGEDPTPEAVERARRRIEDEGSARAVEETLPDEQGDRPGPSPSPGQRRAGW